MDIFVVATEAEYEGIQQIGVFTSLEEAQRATVAYLLETACADVKGMVHKHRLEDGFINWGEWLFEYTWQRESGKEDSVGVVRVRVNPKK